MLDHKKIERAIKRVNKDHRANFIGPEPDTVSTTRHNKYAIDCLTKPKKELIQIGSVYALFSVGDCRSQSRYIISCQQQGDIQGMQLYLGFEASCAMMWQHLARMLLEKSDFENVFANFYNLGPAARALLGAGHSAHATSFAKTCTAHYHHLITGSGGAATGGSKDDIIPFLFIPGNWQDDSSGFIPQSYLDRHGFELYAQLVNIWDRPNPAEVQNTMQALRERRVALACMTDSQHAKTVEFAHYDLLFYDPLLHAVNMRRLELGLETVQYESYIRGVELPLEKVPFVQDDLLYTAYTKSCAEMGETPIDFGDMIKTSQDPISGMLTRQQ